MHALCLNCVDKPGIVAAVATALANAQCNIEESSQFYDEFSGQFFMRVVFRPLEGHSLAGFSDQFAGHVARFGMQWAIHDLNRPVRTMILVSKADHCLHDLLYCWRTKTLPIEITGIVSNHDDLRSLAERDHLPFHYLADTKTRNDDIESLVETTDSELVLLARYMQILPQQLCSKYIGRLINIHHSFLPGFKGAKPYTQAYERGVKIIGATAHFATGDLDEGPIIAQGVEPVDHGFNPERMQRIGRDIEARVLARAVQLYTERRIFLHGQRTVIL